MKSLPMTVAAYKKTPVFTAETVPQSLLRDHRTKAGVWGLIYVSSGRLRYRIAATGEEIELTPSMPGVIEPDSEHSVTPLGEVVFYVEFWR